MLMPESWRKVRKALSLRIALPTRTPTAELADGATLRRPRTASVTPTSSSSSTPSSAHTPPTLAGLAPSIRAPAADLLIYGSGDAHSDSRRALEAIALQEAEEEHRRLEPLLRLLDDSIASFRSPGSARNRCSSASETRLPQPLPSTPPEPCQYVAEFDDEPLFVTAHDDSRPPSPVLEITAVLEEKIVPLCQERENLTVLIHVNAAPAGLGTSCAAGGGSDLTVPGDAAHSEALQQRRRRAAVDLVAVLDVSGSMAGAKLALLKQAMRLVVRSLGDDDRLSVVAFSDSASRMLALRRMSLGGRRAAMEAVDALVCGGGTSICDGLREGLGVLKQRRHHRNPAAAVMLLSDGRDSFTMLSPAPPQDGDDNDNVPVHTFGLGHDHDAVALHGIAQKSGGTFSFVHGEGLLPEAFAQCVGGVLSVVALRVTVALRAVDGAVLIGVDAGGYAIRTAESGMEAEVELGHVYADEERDVLASFRLKAETEAASEISDGDYSRRIIALASARYVDAVTGEWMKTAEMEVAVQRPVAWVGVGGGGGGDLRVERQRDRLSAARAMSEAGQLAERGDLAAARAIVAEERWRLRRESAALRAGDGLSAAVEAELGRYEARMSGPRRYEGAGRAEGLAALASHMRQRAAMRGGGDGGDVYRTPAMDTMVVESRTISGRGC